MRQAVAIRRGWALNMRSTAGIADCTQAGQFLHTLTMHKQAYKVFMRKQLWRPHLPLAPVMACGPGREPRPPAWLLQKWSH
jgi:hypothetical protein